MLHISMSEGNMVARRVVFIEDLCKRRLVWWILENPKRSLLFEFPPVLSYHVAVDAYCASLAMCNYSVDIDNKPEDVPLKEFFFWSNAWWIVLLGGVCQHIVKHKSLMDKGEKWISGNPHLKQSEAYPRSFCLLLIMTWLKFRYADACPWPWLLPGWKCTTKDEQTRGELWGLLKYTNANNTLTEMWRKKRTHDDMTETDKDASDCTANVNQSKI